MHGDIRKIVSDARKGKIKYMKYFNSTKVANYLINKTLDLKDKNSYLWER